MHKWSMSENFRKNFLFVFMLYPPLNLIVLYFIATFKLLNDHFLYLTGVEPLLFGDPFIVAGGILCFFFLKKARNVLHVDESEGVFFKIILNFFISFVFALCCVSFELIGGLVQNFLFGHTTWSYSNEFLNYRGMICLKVFLVFFFSVLFFSFFIFNYFLRIESFIKNEVYRNVVAFRKVIMFFLFFWIIHLLCYLGGNINMWLFYRREENKDKRFLPYPEHKIIIDYIYSQKKKSR